MWSNRNREPAPANDRPLKDFHRRGALILLAFCLAFLLEAAAPPVLPPRQPFVQSTYLPLVIRNPLPEPMITIPAGSFQMGCSPVDNLCHNNELPLHSVYLSTYQIDKYEVTNRQYLACVRAGVCTPPANSSSTTRPSYFGNTDFDRYPVITVTWYQANTFCKWAGKRLPTEAEWEKAARGPSNAQIFPWGNGKAQCSLLNFSNGGEPCVGDTVEVGSYPNGASPYGVYEMAGNVWEWVADFYDFSYYTRYPVNGWPANPLGPPPAVEHAIRGGAWDIQKEGNRVSRREGSLPYDLDPASGFRCAYTPQ